jgi:hypothetical protein
MTKKVRAITSVETTMVTQLLTVITGVIQTTPLASKSADISVIKNKVLPVINRVFNKLDNQDQKMIIDFLQRQPILQDVIIPELVKLVNEGKISTNSIPIFFNILVSIYANVSQFVKDNKQISITSNDIIEIVGLVINVALIIAIPRDDALLTTLTQTVDSATMLVSISVQPKLIKCPFMCCGGSATAAATQA